MSKSLSLGAAAAAALLTFAPSAQAQASRFALGANLGTPGIGAELQYQLSPSLVIRGGGDWLSFQFDTTYAGIGYDAEAKSTTGSIFLDWHPNASSFFVSGGVYFGERQVEFISSNTGPLEIGRLTFSREQVGRIEGRGELSNTQPFLGVGWDNTFTGGGNWGFRAMAGIAFSDEPSVELRAVGGAISNTAIVQAAIAREQAEVEEDVEHLKYFPILQIGVTYRF